MEQLNSLADQTNNLSRPMHKSKSVLPISIEISDIITPKSCSIFVCELIKFIAYNKQQIPYPYERLKMFVMKRREQHKIDELSNTQTESKTSQRVAFLMEKHYKKVEEAYKILDTTFKCIEHELVNSAEQAVEEVVLVFGATPMSPRDVYRINIPSLFFGHSESQHLWKKQIGNLFKGIIMSDEINENFQKKTGVTNMFVLMKVKKEGTISSQWLLPKDHYRISDRAHQVCFTFRSSHSKPCSCCVVDEHEELNQNMNALCISDNLMVSDSVWYQTAKTIKGFRDCKSKGKSITDLWYKHKFL